METPKLLKITQINGTLKVNGKVIGSVFTDISPKQINEHNGVRNTGRAITVTNTISNLYLDNEAISEILGGEVTIDLTNASPEGSSMGRTKVWTSTAVGQLLNKGIGRQVFEQYAERNYTRTKPRRMGQRR